MSPEPRFTIEEIAELARREQAARGTTPDDVSRSLRAQLEKLRAEQGPEPVKLADNAPDPKRLSGRERGFRKMLSARDQQIDDLRAKIEVEIGARVAALEEEMKRLRDRIEGKNG